MHIAVVGNIGVGKTTLTKLLSEHYNWSPLYEDVLENPYLEDFYNQMHRWSFNLQIYFLNSRFRQTLDIQSSGKTMIQDRSIYEDAFIFAPNLHAMGLMSSRDFQNYKSVFDLMSSLIQGPDLLIYLKSSVPNLLRQIKRRGREYEVGISKEYLQNLNIRYDTWIQDCDPKKLLIIDVDTFNFVDRPEDLQEIIHKIDSKINLFTS